MIGGDICIIPPQHHGWPIVKSSWEKAYSVFWHINPYKSSYKIQKHTIGPRFKQKVRVEFLHYPFYTHRITPTLVIYINITAIHIHSDPPYMYVALVWYCWTQIRPTMSNKCFIPPHHPQLRPGLGFDAIYPLTTTHQTNTPNPPSKYLYYRFVMDSCVNSFNKYPSVGK